jgi:putative SOS response-associated peptidase YedK
MCGRFTLRTPHTKLLEQFGVTFQPRYNVAPMQMVLIVRAPGSQRELVPMRFGLAGPQGQLINARAETVATKPTFRESFRQRRCLVPADGFYEWQRDGKRKQPFFIGMKDCSGFAFAGVWQGDAFAILTTQANELVAPLHDRMPVILDPADYDRWLDPATPLDQLPALNPYPADRMEAFPVSPRVNSVTNDDARCLEPIKPDRLLF